jgi:succinate-acetate transporter protein
MTFSGVWLGTALVFAIHPAHGLEVLAVWYLAFCPVLVCLIASATGKLALSLVPTVGLPTFLATGTWLLLGGRLLGELVGGLSFLLAAVGLYAAMALLMEDSRRRTVLPTLRRGAMRTALTGDLQAQLRDIEHEAGVRRSL